MRLDNDLTSRSLFLHLPTMLTAAKTQTYDDYWVWTVQISRWRLARDLYIPMVDITVKSGIPTFSPTWENLMAYKRGEMTKTAYAQAYFQKVIPTVQSEPQAWADLTQHKNIALACYCRAGDFCHRHLFAGLYITYLQSLGHKVLFMGELIEAPEHREIYFPPQFPSDPS